MPVMGVLQPLKPVFFWPNLPKASLLHISTWLVRLYFPDPLHSICQKGPLGIRKSKEAMIEGYDMTLEKGLKLEYDLMVSLQDTEDFVEGAKSFVEKRKPNWQAK